MPDKPITPRHRRFIEDVKRLQLRFPVATLEKLTGDSKGNISNFLSGKKPVSDNFLKKFYEKYNAEENILDVEEGDKGIGLQHVDHPLQVEEPFVPLKNGTQLALEDISKQLEDIRRGIAGVNANVYDNRAETLQVESLSRTILTQTAYLESKQHGGDYIKRAAELNDVSLKLYEELLQKSGVLVRKGA